MTAASTNSSSAADSQALTLDGLLALLPPGWRLAAQFLYRAAVDTGIRLFHAGIVNGSINVIHSAATASFCDRRWFESALAVSTKMARETCALCGTAPARRSSHARNAPAGLRVCGDCNTDLQTEEWQVLEAEWRAGRDVESLLTSEPTIAESPTSAAPVSPKKLLLRSNAAKPEQRPLVPAMASDLDMPLGPDQLRELWAKLLAALQRRIAGNESAVRRLALIGALHVGAAPEVGARLLVLGGTGAGKSHALHSLIDALAECGYPLPFVWAETGNLTSPGWGKALSVGEMIVAALGPRSVTSADARRAIIVLDEIHHSRVAGDDDSNMRMRREEVLASLLSVVAGDQVALGEKSEVWSARQALVITAGAFTDLDITPENATPKRLAAVGIQPELANRLVAGEVLGMVPPPRRELVRVLEQWPELLSLGQTVRRLGFTLSVPQATLYRTAALIVDGLHGDTLRSAGGTLVSAARQHLMTALEQGAPGNELVVTPDDIRTHRMTRPAGDPRRDPPDEFPIFR